MGGMTQAAALLKAEVQDAVIAEVGRVGPGGFSKDAIVKRFADRGAGRTTLYRWVDECLASGEPGQRLAKQVKAAAERRAARSPKPAEDAVREVAETLPALITVGDAAGCTTIAVIDRIRDCIVTAEQVMAYARTEGGQVRNAKLLVTASEHLRRSIETASRLYDSIVAVQRIDQFNNELLEAIEAVHAEHPEAAELIIRRTHALADRWLLEETAAGRTRARTR